MQMFGKQAPTDRWVTNMKNTSSGKHSDKLMKVKNKQEVIELG